MRTYNKCQWLVHGSTELCSKNCIKTFCRIHNKRIKEGGGTRPCQACGIGISNQLGLCKNCSKSILQTLL